MADNITPVVNETKPVSDEVSVITEGTIIKGDIVSNGSLDIRRRCYITNDHRAKSDLNSTCAH